MLEYDELGMEAVWKIEVEDFPAFIVVDDKGNDFFAETPKPIALTVADEVGREGLSRCALRRAGPGRVRARRGGAARAADEDGADVRSSSCG